MPELRDKQLPNFTPAGPEIDIHAISFKDKTREAARQKRLAAELAAGGKNAKQIKAEQRAAERISKQKERRATEIAKGRNPNKKKGKQAKVSMYVYSLLYQSKGSMPLTHIIIQYDRYLTSGMSWQRKNACLKSSRRRR